MRKIVFILLAVSLALPLCAAGHKSNDAGRISTSNDVVLGASRTTEYIHLLQGKRVALLSNHSGIIPDGKGGWKHVLDHLIENGVQMTAIFSPEHGFRGTAAEGELVASSTDEKTGLPICSTYDGKGVHPSAERMALFDVLVVDIQDVGLRFSTYHITMIKMMEACAEYGKQVVVMDRPNPNGHYVDGPILDMQYKSGVGWVPIPVVYGMTMGELALMVNDKGWLPEGRKVDLTVIPCLNYTHQTAYRVPINTSPNLRCLAAIYMYPSICLFEATPLSLGRGTEIPFLCYGHPLYRPDKQRVKQLEQLCGMKIPTIDFHPTASTQKGRDCTGLDLSGIAETRAHDMGIDLNFIIDAYQAMSLDDHFFRPFFERLIGVGYVRKMIKQGKTNDEIRAMWTKDVEQFLIDRRPYLLYEEH